MFAPAAFADEIGDAAKKLAEASYPFAKEVDWNNGIYLQAPGSAQSLAALQAIDGMIVMGSRADPAAGVEQPLVITGPASGPAAGAEWPPRPTGRP